MRLPDLSAANALGLPTYSGGGRAGFTPASQFHLVVCEVPLWKLSDKEHQRDNLTSLNVKQTSTPHVQLYTPTSESR